MPKCDIIGTHCSGIKCYLTCECDKGVILLSVVYCTLELDKKNVALSVSKWEPHIWFLEFTSGE